MKGETAHFCINCMKRKEENVCPFCGYDAAAYQPYPHQLQPETILNGKYLVGRVLGEGGFGITYVGWNLALEVKVAVKEYYPSGMVTRDCAVSKAVSPYSGEYGEHFAAGKNKFIREARTLAKFDHLKEVVKVRDFFMENNTSYIVMEYLDGTPLNKYVEQEGGGIDPGTIFPMMEPIIHALGLIHREGLIHRDISPDNLMVMEDRSLKLLDFGAARDFTPQGEARSRTLLLKLGYAPVEQYHSSGRQGPWTDVYALCATLYYCLAGEVPPEALDRSQSECLIPLKELGIRIGEERENAINKGLSILAENRFQSMEDLHDALYIEKRTKQQEETARQGDAERTEGAENAEKMEDAAPEDGIRLPAENKRVGRDGSIIPYAAAALCMAAVFLIIGAVLSEDGRYTPKTVWGILMLLLLLAEGILFFLFRRKKLSSVLRRKAGRPPSVPYLEYRENGNIYRIVLDKEEVTIGRLPGEVDFIVNNRRVGKRHAQFVTKNGKVYVRDLNSRNGTYINGSGRRIRGGTLCPLENGDKVTLADSDFFLICGNGKTGGR